MTRLQFLRLLETRFELPENTLSGQEKLADCGWFDSLGVLQILAILDDRLGVRLSVESVLASTTVDDLVHLWSDRSAA